MGKSDNFVFPFYLEMLKDLRPESVAFLGFDKENFLTQKINSPVRKFYDINLGNWNINDDWYLDQKYDLIVCTRCAYFSKDPHTFLEKCKSHLTNNGNAFVDWGLGDHWRYKNYKVGWIRDGEHEKAYFDNNFLYSCYWNSDLENDLQVKNFWNAVKLNNFNYSEDLKLTDIIEKEVPKVLSYECIKIKTLFLWPESPQLYIATLFKKGN